MEESQLKLIGRQSTWLSQAETPPVIEKFLKNYPKSHLHILATRAKELIEEELGKAEWNDVHVNIRCRAKDPKSLKEKLKMRHWDVNTALKGASLQLTWPDMPDPDDRRRTFTEVSHDRNYNSVSPGNQEFWIGPHEDSTDNTPGSWVQGFQRRMYIVRGVCALLLNFAQDSLRRIQAEVRLS